MKITTFLRSLPAVLTACMFLLPSSPAGATVVMPINLAESVARSETIAEVRIDSAERLPFKMGWGDRYTATTVDLLAGDQEKNSETVTWTQYRFSEHSPVAAMPAFEPGERVLLFLPPKGDESPFQAPLGLGQGVFRIHKNAETGETTAVNAFGNMNLFQRMEVPTLAVAIHEKMSKREAEKAEDGEAAPVPDAGRLHLALLQGERGGISLDILKDAIGAIKAHKGEDLEKAFAGEDAPRQPIRVPIATTPKSEAGD